jgi:alpha-ribazole phosphatase
MTNPTITRWWWLRHAPVVNPDGIFYGQLDFPADLDGHVNVPGQAGRLPQEALWFTTPLVRTGQTAQALMSAADIAITPTLEPQFIEQDFGTWQGRKRADIYAEMSRDHPYWHSPATTAPPQGESFNTMAERVHTCIEAMNRRHAGQNLVVVAHGGPIRAAVALALNLDTDTASTSLSIDTLSLTRLDHIDDGESPVWVVETLNMKAT